jgi:hypothetical protein
VLLRTIAVLAAMAALAGCGSQTATAPSTTTSAAEGDFPPGCQVSDVDRIVTAFLRTPDLAPASFFETYGSYESDGRKFVTRRRAAALTHLRGRQALGERRRLLSLRALPQDVNHVRITFSLTRSAPDFRDRGIHTRLAQGAGTIDCAHAKVAAWVMRGP